MITKFKEECPHLQHTGGYSSELDDYIDGTDMCRLADKPCITEGCKVYKEYLQDLEAEEQVLIEQAKYVAKIADIAKDALRMKQDLHELHETDKY